MPCNFLEAQSVSMVQESTAVKRNMSAYPTRVAIEDLDPQSRHTHEQAALPKQHAA